MRTIIDLPEEQIAPLKDLAKSLNVSRAELIRRAVTDFLRRHEVPAEDAAFGIWKGRDEDGVAYQECARSEWDR